MKLSKSLIKAFIRCAPDIFFNVFMHSGPHNKLAMVKIRYQPFVSDFWCFYPDVSEQYGQNDKQCVPWSVWSGSTRFAQKTWSHWTHSSLEPCWKINFWWLKIFQKNNFNSSKKPSVRIMWLGVVSCRVWGMILQWGSTIKVTIELPVATRHCRDMAL